jgi:glucose/arabinose dehydrogenase/PKD repeat protein
MLRILPGGKAGPSAGAALVTVVGLLVAIGLGGPVLRPGRASAADLPAGFQETTLPFEGISHPQLNEPTVLRFAADGRVFVAQRSGQILVYDSVDDPTPTVFADLRTPVYDNGDRGILGLALDPDFPAKPYVYVLYTYNHLLGDPAPAPKWSGSQPEGDPCPKPPGADVDACPVSGRLVRLTAEGDHAVPTSGAPAEKVLVEDWCQQFSSHSIGDLQFGPEGALFASGGDGASFTSPDYGQFGWPQKNQCGDPPAGVGGEEKPPTALGGSMRAQNVENLDGSVIRIDPESGAGLPDNPMATSLDANARRIIAYGFRNPFRFAIDPETSEIYVDNVGWDTYEEIDRFSTVPSPAYNSGWPCYEGPSINPGFQSLELNACKALYEQPGSTAPPFFYYEHGHPITLEDPCPDGSGSAITGNAIYAGAAFPASYEGALFFADSVRGCVYAMFPGADGRPDPATVTPFMTEAGFAGADLEEGPEGSLYYTVLFEGGEYAPNSGSIHRITYSSGNQPPVADLTVDKEFGPAPLLAHFDASGSTDADGEALSYEWDLAGDGSFGSPSKTAKTKSKTFSDSENHTVAVRVSDEQGASSVDRVTVYPGDKPPEPEIVSPTESSPGSGQAALEWHVGEPIQFEGVAHHEGGDLPSTSLDWSSRLYHCPSACHTHPLQAFPAVDSGTLIAPDHDYPSHIQLTLTATDARGLSANQTIQLFPRTVELDFDSSPTGLTLTAGQLTKPGPFEVTAIEDSKITVSAPATALAGGEGYAWTGWSDGGERVHTIEAASSGSYLAEYTGTGPPPPGAEPAAPGGGAPASQPPAQQPGKSAPPRTTLGAHPAARTVARGARFTFSSDQPGASFRCKLDRAPYKSCRSPLHYRHLKLGKHVLRVLAVISGGAPDPTPAVFSWRVLPPR